MPLPLRQLPKLADQAELRAKAGAMPPQEWRDFWSAVECCMRLQVHLGPDASRSLPAAPAHLCSWRLTRVLPHDPSCAPTALAHGSQSQDADAKMVPAPADDRISSGKRARLARCGTCVGCTRGDCGECKNCKDKPKYGGPGIKKQACLQRACNNPLIDHSTDIDGVKEGFLSLEPSPALRPTEVSPEEVAPLDLGAEEVLDDEADVPDPTTSGMMLATRRRLDELRASQYGEPDVNSTELDAATAYSTADEAGDTDDVETHVQSHEAGPDGFPITASLLMVAAARAGDAALLQGDRTSSSSIPG